MNSAWGAPIKSEAALEDGNQSAAGLNGAGSAAAAAVAGEPGLPAAHAVQQSKRKTSDEDKGDAAEAALHLAVGMLRGELAEASRKHLAQIILQLLTAEGVQDVQVRFPDVQCAQSAVPVPAPAGLLRIAVFSQWLQRCCHEPLHWYKPASEHPS